MKFDIDQIKKKIIYRANYRGTKEMDKLLGAFIKKYINILDNKDLLDLMKLLDVDDNSLYNVHNGLEIDLKMEDNNINNLFKNFNYKDCK